MSKIAYHGMAHGNQHQHHQRISKLAAKTYEKISMGWRSGIRATRGKKGEKRRGKCQKPASEKSIKEKGMPSRKSGSQT